MLMDNNFRIPNFDMEALKTFFMVVKCRSFSEAADRLHKTPAAISYRIRALEDQVGMPLFKRSTRNVELLPSGEHLMEHVSQIYTILQEIPRELQQLSLGVEPFFSIAINNLIGTPEGTSNLVSLLHDRFPDTNFNLERCVYMGVWDSLMRGDVNFAIGVPTWHPISNEFSTIPAGEIRWTFVCAPTHPVAKLTDDVLTDDILRQYPAVNVEDTAVTLRKRTAWLLRGQKEIVVPNLATKLKCHLKGVGVGFLPEKMVEPYIRSGELVTRKVSNPRNPSPMGIAWKKDGEGKILQFMKDLFEKRDPAIEPYLRNMTPAERKAVTKEAVPAA